MNRRNDKSNNMRSSIRFPERQGKDWVGPIVDYKETELLRKFLTSSSKLMSRKRGGTTSQEQKSIKKAIKQARYMALLSYTSS